MRWRTRCACACTHPTHTSSLRCAAVQRVVVLHIWKDYSAFNLHTQAFFLNYLTLKMKALWSFGTSATTNLVTQCHIPEDLNLQQHSRGVSKIIKTLQSWKCHLSWCQPKLLVTPLLDILHEGCRKSSTVLLWKLCCKEQQPEIATLQAAAMRKCNVWHGWRRHHTLSADVLAWLDHLLDHTTCK